MRAVLVVIIGAAVGACSYNPPGQAVSGSDVGGTGNVSVNHEPLGSGKHMLVVSAAPGLAETEGSIGQRILITANRYAARTCAAGFQFDHDPNLAQPPGAGFMVRSRTFVFRCT